MRYLLLTAFLLMSLIAMSQNITFSSSIIYEDNPYNKNPQSEFNANESIYGVVKQSTPIMNIPISDNPNPRVMIGYFVKIDGTPVVSFEVGTFAQVVPGAMYSKEFGDTYDTTPFAICLIPSENDRFKQAINKQGPFRAFTSALSNIGIGVHKVNVEIRFMDGGIISEPIAIGSFDIKMDESVQFKSVSRFPEAKLKDEKLAQSMVKALKDGGWDYTVKKLNIVLPDWQIHRNNFGYITKRTIDTFVAFQMNDGGCKVFNISFKQDYNGNLYGITQVNGIGENFILDCKEVQ